MESISLNRISLKPSLPDVGQEFLYFCIRPVAVFEARQKFLGVLLPKEFAVSLHLFFTVELLDHDHGFTFTFIMPCHSK